MTRHRVRTQCWGLAAPLLMLIACVTGQAAPAQSRPNVAPSPRPVFKLDAILKHLARPAPASTPFIEAHFSALLSRPLIVSGRLEYLGPNALARQVERPYHERAEIRGGEVTVSRAGERPKHFSLQRVPAMRSLLASFTALLGGRVRALKQHFRLDLHGDAHAWTIGLTPRDPTVRQSIRAITVSGNGYALRCLETFEANDDVTVTLLAHAARLRVPARPSQAWFDAACHGAHAPIHRP